MSRTIRRGAPPGRPQPRRKVATRKTSTLDRIIATLPIGETTLHRIATGGILAFTGTVAVAVAIWLGVPGMAGAAIAEGVGRAGFRVEQIEITGLKRMDRMTVYAVALEDKQHETPMLAVDLDAIRARLLRYGWIADAHVSRRFPDTLLVDIVERTPAAVWQDAGALTLVDANGVALEPVDPGAMPDLPLVIGPGADREEPAYQALLAAAPGLRPRIRAATWIGNRRWDLLFDSGETLALPEENPTGALAKFASLQQARPLLGRGWIRFDLRDPSKLVARKPGASLAHAVPDDGAPASVPASPTPASSPPASSGSPRGTEG